MSVLPDLKTMPDSALLKLRGQVLDSWADSLEDRRCDPGLALKFRNQLDAIHNEFRRRRLKKLPIIE